MAPCFATSRVTTELVLVISSAALEERVPAERWGRASPPAAAAGDQSRTEGPSSGCHRLRGALTPARLPPSRKNKAPASCCRAPNRRGCADISAKKRIRTKIRNLLRKENAH